MSDTYTKLFSSITESTVWGEPYATRIVWVAMLAMADARGNVYGAVPGLARRANVTLEEVEAALKSGRPIERPVLGIGIMDNVEIGAGKAVFLTLAAAGHKQIEVHIPSGNRDEFSPFTKS